MKQSKTIVGVLILGGFGMATSLWTFSTVPVAMQPEVTATQRTQPAEPRTAISLESLRPLQPPPPPRDFGPDSFPAVSNRRTGPGRADRPRSAAPASVAQLMTLDPASLREVVRTSNDPIEVQAAVWAMANRLRLSDEDAEVLLDSLEQTDPDQVDLLKTTLWALTLRPDALPVEIAADWAVEHESPDVVFCRGHHYVECASDVVFKRLIRFGGARSGNRAHVDYGVCSTYCFRRSVGVRQVPEYEFEIW